MLPERGSTTSTPETAVLVVPIRPKERCGHHSSIHPATVCGAPAFALVGGVPYCREHAAERIAAEAEHDLYVGLARSDSAGDEGHT